MFHERRGETLGPEQEIDIRFREEPYSVDLRWIKNPGRAKRVTYVDGRRSEQGQPLAHIELTGMLGVLTPAGVWRPIHGSEFLAESRRPVDQFGFRNTLEQFVKECRSASGKPGFRLGCLGTDFVGDRLCLVFERRLPFPVDRSPFCDRLVMLYLDCEWLVPLAVHAFADDEGTQLLGRYTFTQVELNVGLTDADF